MYQSRCAIHALAFTGFFVASCSALARADQAAARGIAIADFVYLDTSQEPTDQSAAHQKRLEAFMATLRRDVGADGRYAVVSCASPCTDRTQGGPGIVIAGAIQKTSTLVQWAKVSAVDVEANRLLFDKLYTFRGDTDEAWARAESFIAGQIRAALAAPAPVKLAAFDFELEDESAGAATTGETASDASQLTETTNQVRRLLAESGRYQLIDVSSVDTDAAKTHTVHDCNGCDAPLALKLGAEQSFVGVIRRISRTEYAVRFQIRDARTGAIVSEGDSGLRMGANYSWSRGAARLVSDRVIDSHAQQ